MKEFQIVVNPFTREMLIAKNHPNKKEVKSLYFDDLDEWHHVEFKSDIINFHFFYEGELLVSIYRIVLVDVPGESYKENMTDYNNSLL